MNATGNSLKMHMFNYILDRGSNAFVHFDTQYVTGLPLKVWQEGHCVLEYKEKTLPDLSVGVVSGIKATLSFGGKRNLVTVPWEQVYALVDQDGKGMTWEEALPDTVKAAYRAEIAPNIQPLDAPQPGLRAIQGGGKPRQSKASVGRSTRLRLVH
jgi:stringent starvation protein B